MTYTDYAAYIDRFFPGQKIQKISVNTGCSCPNRDGTIGTGGCIYCDNSSFTPSYCMQGDPIRIQLEKGKEFFSRKYREMKFLAYFQSYTSTNTGADTLHGYMEEAMSVPDIVGIVIGTRPDCLPDDVVQLLGETNCKCRLFVELGVETSFDSTLALINRGHTWTDTVDSIRRLDKAGIEVGVHLIAGLPGETDEMVIETIRKVCLLPVSSIKLHQLQVISGTRLHRDLTEGKLSVRKYTVDEYLDLCVRVVSTVPPEIAIERFLASSPPEKVISPRWGLKNYQFSNLLKQRLK